MSLESFKRCYWIGAVIVWVGIILALALVLSDTPYFAQVLPIIGGGVVFFVVIITGVLYRVECKGQ